MRLYLFSATLEFSMLINSSCLYPSVFSRLKLTGAMGIDTEEELVSSQCKSPKIRKLGKCLLLRGFTELQECISRKLLAESAGWKCRAAVGLATVVFLSGRSENVCACARAAVRARVSSVAAFSGSC